MSDEVEHVYQIDFHGDLVYYLFIYLFILLVFIYRLHVLTPPSGRRDASLVLRPLIGFLSASLIVRQLSKAKSAAKPQVSTALHYTITVCCNRTE